MRRFQLLLTALSLILLAQVQPAWSAQNDREEIGLPKITGTQAVGTAVWHWQARREGSDAGVIEVMAQLWYPSDVAGGSAARYRPLGGQPFDQVVQSSVGSAPFASMPDKSPVVVVCPGRGTNRYYYTSLAEDLASHGFAVFAVDIPGIGYAEFPDGRVIEPSNKYKPSFELITGPYEKVDAFFEPAVDIGLEHLSLALEKLATLNDNDPAGIVTGRLEMKSIGIFGHSLGGRLCGALAGSDSRVVAFAAMEGVPPRKIRRKGMAAASLMLYSSELPEEMALPNIREVFVNRKAEATIMRLEGFGHNSVTDRPIIFPEQFDHEVTPERGIEVFREVLLAFFEAHLKHGRFSPTEIAAAPEVSLIETSITVP
jgi:dienelactone hydrolase